MPTLYYAPNACSLAPHIVLEWIGAPYEAVRVQYGSEELLSINPAGAVPTFREDDGWLLTQAGAILDYLANKHPEALLGGGENMRARAEARRWSAFFTSDVHASFWPIFIPKRYSTDVSKEAQLAVIEAGQALVSKQLHILDCHLDGREFVLGDRRSIIDAYSFPMIRWAVKLLPSGLMEYPNVQPLHDRIFRDAAVQKILSREAASTPTTRIKEFGPA